MTRLVVAAEADADLNEILDYLHKEARAGVADQYGARFRVCIARLVEFPGIGSPRPALGAKTRVTAVPPYLLIYDYDKTDDTLSLLRILHSKRDVAARLIRPK